MKEIADEILMLQYAQGDEQAFTALYIRHKNSLYRYFIRQIATQALAEELYQEVWNKLIKVRLNYQVNSKFTTWLYRIAHNELIDYYRRNATEKRVIAINIEQVEEPKENSEGHLESTMLVDEHHTTAFEELYQYQQATQLKWCLKQLPRKQKEAFLLKHEAGLTLNEIAKLIGESSENIKSRIRYGLDRLKHCVMTKMEKKDGQ
jgi:RNA polymerase sigma-70 factor, ECF subfamily